MENQSPTQELKQEWIIKDFATREILKEGTYDTIKDMMSQVEAAGYEINPANFDQMPIPIFRNDRPAMLWLQIGKKS